MGAQTDKHEMDMCSGPLTRKILVFSLPLMLSGILQLLYNAADVVVVGRFCGATALAAVGSTGALVNLIINLFIGLSVGASVTVARFYGANQLKDVRQTVHTAMLISIIGGVVLGVVGAVFSRTFLEWMASPEDVIGQATVYLRIYFYGMPFNLMYNFAAGILRAVGDTKRPLYYLTISGAINVVLNLFFVLVAKIGVAGVAWATIISQAVALVLILVCMLRSQGAINLRFQELHIYRDKLLSIVKVGLPAGIQGSIFSISNVLIQSSVNSFGSTVMAGNSAAANLEGFTYTAMNSFYQAALSFSGQNMGARKYKRVGKVLGICILLVSLFGIGMSAIEYLFRNQLLSIYTTDPAVIEKGLLRVEIFAATYFTCGIMDVIVGELRGMGYSVTPMLVSILGVCGIRIAWIYTVFQKYHTLQSLYISYPVSWVITGTIHLICFFVLYRKLRRKDGSASTEPTAEKTA